MEFRPTVEQLRRHAQPRVPPGPERVQHNFKVQGGYSHPHYFHPQRQRDLPGLCRLEGSWGCNPGQKPGVVCVVLGLQRGEYDKSIIEWHVIADDRTEIGPPGFDTYNYYARIFRFSQDIVNLELDYEIVLTEN